MGNLIWQYLSYSSQTQKDCTLSHSMNSAELRRELFFHLIPLTHGWESQHSNSNSPAERFWEAWVENWPPSHLLPRKSRWCSNSPGSWDQPVELSAEFIPRLRGDKTVGVCAPLSLGSCHWNKGQTEPLPHPFTRQCNSVHFCQGGGGRDQRKPKHTHPAAHVLNLNKGLRPKRKIRLNKTQSCTLYYPKCSVHNLKKSKHEWEKTVDVCQWRDESNGEIIWQLC